MGGNQCCVISCRATSHDHQGRKLDNGLSFYRFPAWKQTGGTKLSEITKRRRMAWITAVERSDLTFDKIPVSIKVCSRHFESGQPANEMLEDDPDWAPHLHLKQDEPSDATTTTTTTTVGEDGDQLQEPGEDNQNGDGGEPEAKRARGARSGSAECEFCSVRRDQINRLLAENQELRYELERRRFDELFLEEDDEKVRYYTGLQCFAVLMGILQHILPHLPDDEADRRCNRRRNDSSSDDDSHHHASATDTTSTPTTLPPPPPPTLLSPFQKLLLTLMRLRLDLPVGHLAYLFGVAPETVARTFRSTVRALYTQLGPLVSLPERGSLLAGVPTEFASSLGPGRATLVLDCLEINVQRPNSMKGREQTYSYQRHAYTMKYLLAITPQGAIAFISPAVGGRATDMQVAEASGILERLSCGDYVLAERGFELKESVGVMCAQVKSSAFGKGRRQFDVKSEEETRTQVAHLRAHLQQVVEVCQVQQHFMLLEKMVVPMNMLLPTPPEGATTGPNQLPLLDQIVAVCCALLNMSPNVNELSDD